MGSVFRVRRRIAESINPKEAKLKTKVHGKNNPFKAFVDRQKDKQNKQNWYTVYRQGAEVSAAIDTYALFTVSDKAKLVTDSNNKEEQRRLDEWWDAIDGITMLRSAITWSLVFGEAVFEKGLNVNNQVVKLKYIDGRTTTLDLDESDELTKVVQHNSIFDKKIILMPDEAIVIRLFPDIDGWHGLSLIDRNYDNIKRKVMTDEGIANYIKRHGFPKFHIIQSPAQEGGTVPDKVLDNLETDFKDMNSQNEFISDHNLEIKPLDNAGKVSIKDFNEWAITLITAGLGVPEEMLGLGRGSTEATAKVRMTAFEYIINAIRYLTNSQLQRQLYEDLKTQLNITGRIRLDFPDINPKTEAEKADWISKLMPPGDPFSIYTVDEIREKMGDSPYPKKKGATA